MATKNKTDNFTKNSELTKESSDWLQSIGKYEGNGGASLKIGIFKEMMKLNPEKREDYLKNQDLGDRTTKEYLTLSKYIKQNSRTKKYYFDEKSIEKYWRDVYPITAEKSYSKLRNVPAVTKTNEETKKQEKIKTISKPIEQVVTKKEEPIQKESQESVLSEPQLIPIPVNKTDSEQEKLNKELFIACYKGDLEGVRKSIDNEAKLNEKDKYGWTPLHHATYSKYSHNDKIIELLIDSGSNVNAQDHSGNTALHYAIMRTNDNAFSAIINCKDLDLDKRNQMGHSPILYAVIHNNSNYFEKLIDKGADVNVTYNVPGMRNNLTLLSLLMEESAQVSAPKNYGSFSEQMKEINTQKQEELYKMFKSLLKSDKVVYKVNKETLLYALKLPNEAIHKNDFIKGLVEEGNYLKGLNQSELYAYHEKAKEYKNKYLMDKIYPELNFFYKIRANI